jgi:hypothetical protein
MGRLKMLIDKSVPRYHKRLHWKHGGPFGTFSIENQGSGAPLGLDQGRTRNPVANATGYIPSSPSGLRKPPYLSAIQIRISQDHPLVGF